MSDFTQRLESVLQAHIEEYLSLERCERLSGGANQETYRIVIRARDGERTLCMRRAAGGEEDLEASGQPGLAMEAKLFRAAAAAGVPEPQIYHVLQPEDGLGPGFLMQWLEGETLGARIARGESLAGVRPMLAHQCGVLLARIHAIDVKAAGLDDRLTQRVPEEIVRMSWERYQAFGTPQPMIDYTARWLLENLPQSTEQRLVHGDFRNGNLMVDPDRGVIAVLDWEGAHIGDPLRDLGWLCTNSWRFGVPELEVGGFGHLSDLLAGYNSESGRDVDPEQVKFWIVYGSFNWAIGCLTMAEHYRHGPDATVERPAIGRRSSECQIDCVNLLIPGQVSLPEPSHDEADLDLAMPRSDELMTSVRDFLREDVFQATEGRNQFMARVAANSLDILLRERQLGALYRSAEQDMLEQLLGAPGGYFDLRSKLCARIRDGSLALNDEALQAYLRQSVLCQVMIDQPRYSGARVALARD